MNTKILIQTALSLEFNAVKAFLENIEIRVHPVTKSIYNQGTYSFKNFIYDVLLVETGPGNSRASDETGRAIEFLKPDYVFFVGVAGGLKDVKIGDVVASSKVIGFEMGKDDEVFKPRPDTMPSSYILEQLAKHIKRENKWVENIGKSESHYPDAFVQPIASGEKVVSSNKSVAFSYLRQHCSDAVAVDMEGNGFLTAARPYQASAIEIRGISDLIENKEEADACGSQPKAATNAAIFMFAMIDQLSLNNSIMQRTDTLEFKKKFVDELAKLYPQGPEQDNIWKRAGGDVSILINASSRKSQWYDAIEKLSLGGGGKDISMMSLINEVKDDYPSLVSSIFN